MVYRLALPAGLPCSSSTKKLWQCLVAAMNQNSDRVRWSLPPYGRIGDCALRRQAFQVIQTRSAAAAPSVLDFPHPFYQTALRCIQCSEAAMDNSAELNRLVREMNDGPEAGSADSSATARLDHWLTTLVSRAGSDLLLVENAPPCIRVQGELRKIESDVLDGADVEAAVVPALSAHALRVYRESLIADSSYRITGVGRFRINLHRERGRAAATIRALPSKIPFLPGFASARARRESGATTSRPGLDRRPGRFGKVHHARCADPRNQSPGSAPYRDDRRSHRIRAHAHSQRH